MITMPWLYYRVEIKREGQIWVRLWLGMVPGPQDCQFVAQSFIIQIQAVLPIPNIKSYAHNIYSFSVLQSGFWNPLEESGAWYYQFLKYFQYLPPLQELLPVIYPFFILEINSVPNSHFISVPSHPTSKVLIILLPLSDLSGKTTAGSLSNIIGVYVNGKSTPGAHHAGVPQCHTLPQVFAMAGSGLCCSAIGAG